ncbi:MAG TPA: hypothetical protein PLE19_11900 [Planctomycetota bacterium]|nr:hypothetical protein [Planctomycetota bacterium]HRR81079.1 hypothetical protein [Planctomycetota bacterium]HRT94341.1 hypothetical protein [Planctomycetota bacterium]
MRWRSSHLSALLVTATLAAAPASAWAAAKAPAGNEGPSKLELSGAEKRLVDFERKVERANGQPFPLGYTENEALKRVKDLKERFPDDPKVDELFERGRKALIASKGEAMTLGPEATAYRLNEQKLKGLFSEKADKELAALMAEVEKDKASLTQPFPAPSHREVEAEALKGKFVVLKDFEYPANEFTDFHGQYVYVGSGTKGFYFVQLSGRPWLGAYEALRRYRRLVNRDLPEDGKWTLIGRVTGLEMLVPDAGKEKVEVAQWGWGVEPVAIHVPGCTLAVADPKAELGGAFSGEAEMEQIKGAMYTIKSVPDDATPERLTEIYIAAIKEKNYPLFLDCIDPNRRATRTALSRIGYHWDLHQERFAKLYCHVVVGPAKTQVLKGFDEKGDLEGFFLSEEDKAKIKQHAEALVEVAELTTKAYDERGRQYGSPKPRFFKRTEKKRWYITNYDQPF